MTSHTLKKTLVFSLLGHLAVFSVFSFSFGYKYPKADYAVVAFWGQILRNYDLNPQIFKPRQIPIKPHFQVSSQATNNISISSPYLKPTINLTFNPEKIIFVEKTSNAPFIKRRKEAVLMFYPLLPYHFLLYFKDRQTAHIELLFNVTSAEKTNSITIKRKISSGNLEADLLTMRYISHYLFIEQARFTPNNWQAVKIDLSTKND